LLTYGEEEEEFKDYLGLLLFGRKKEQAHSANKTLQVKHNKYTIEISERALSGIDCQTYQELKPFSCKI